MSLLKKLPGRRVLRKLQCYLPPLNFITLHYLCFIATALTTSVIFYCISTPAWSIPYVDCLFLQVSALTEAGLNTYNLSEMNTVQQWMLFTQIIAGSAVFVSMSVLQVRKRAFERRFGSLVKQQREERRKNILRDSDEEVLNHTPNHPIIDSAETIEPPTVENRRNVGPAAAIDVDAIEPAPKNEKNMPEHISFSPTKTKPSTPQEREPARKKNGSIFSFKGVGAHPVETTAFRRPGFQSQPGLTARSTEKSRDDGQEHGLDISRILTKDVIGRNSQFHNLSLEEREVLGGVEYRAIRLLSWIVPIYFVLFQLLACLGIGAWMAHNARDITERNGINPWWNGAFNAVSAFNNSGMSLLDANMIPFQTSTYPVITMGFLILAGNTAYPVFLRFILWTLYKLLPERPRFQGLRETFRFVLDHPRRVYTNLFPSHATWWLLMTIVFLNCTDWIFFELLNIGNTIVESLPMGSRILDGLFQALAVRSGGFYIVPIAQIRIGVQVLYVVMMYISVYPVAITTRSSNVYEERSLGIYAEDISGSGVDGSEEHTGMFDRIRRTMTGASSSVETRQYFVRQQMAGQLAHDLSGLVVAIFLITCIEASGFERDPITYSVFNVTFEVVSAYGCVGISTGVADNAYSFAGGWHLASKLILCVVMLRGRHRGLPVALDRAVLLPGEVLGSREEEDHALRKQMSRREADGEKMA